MWALGHAGVEKQWVAELNPLVIIFLEIVRAPNARWAFPPMVFVVRGTSYYRGSGFPITLDCLSVRYRARVPYWV
jgi:hypothetical protein